MSRLKSNAATQREWEKRTREKQIARQREQGVRTPPRRALSAPGRVVVPPEPKPVPGPPVVYPPAAGSDAEREAARAAARRRRKQRDSSPEAVAMRRQVKRRSGGLCEANWPGVCPDGPHPGEEVHHVWLRSQGGPDHVNNGLHLCGRVHDHAHDVDRAGAEARGIIRSRPADPLLPLPASWPGGIG